MSWLETPKNLDTENTRDSEAATDPTSSAAGISESLIQRGDKSDRRVANGLLSLLSPRHTKDLESCVPRQECREKGYATKERPWLDALKRLEEAVCRRA